MVPERLPRGWGGRLRGSQDTNMMTEREIEAKLAELDRLLNDPETRMDPHKVWSQLAELRDKPPANPVLANGRHAARLAGA
jgi:hypothetical protein